MFMSFSRPTLPFEEETFGARHGKDYQLQDRKFLEIVVRSEVGRAEFGKGRALRWI